ncbi:inner membrane protein YhjD [Gordonia jinhuaensis]|uniref:Inner membrane protein YhjD n=1 Tax=Gordonia jinhuaensis TaxID=1517702 RepID=A0A916SUW2_9ACTN|nr:inner membrane protein YhjD [Gordonia jinhuaensis]GGB17057.1 inner membrane protein YhjD [Gordonia jinhuaensis]
MAASAQRQEESSEPSRLDKVRAKSPGIDHLVEAAQRYQNQKGDYFAAGATYFSVFAIFPLLMVAFATAGFVLSSHPELLDELRDHISSAMPGSTGDSIKDLIDQAIDSRTTIGIVGLVGALYSGMGWMANIRQALTVQWGTEPEKPNFLRTKISDLLALIGLFVALAISFGLSALGASSLTTKILQWLHVSHLTGAGVAVRVVSILLSIAASWLLFTWIIAKLPRVALPLRNAAKAGLVTAIGFEVFKYIATFYLQKVVSGPAGATFGPILGIMVFAFFTTRIVLFATAWAATDPDNKKYEPVAVPDPVVIAPVVRENSMTRGGVIVSMIVGALTAWKVSDLVRRR